MSTIQAQAPRRGRFDTTVVFNRSLCREHYQLRLRVAGNFSPTRPGQFVQLGCRQPDGAIDEPSLLGRTLDWQPGQRPSVAQRELCGPTAFLRRPFSLAGRGDDEDGTWIDVIHRVVGVGTQWLAQLSASDPADLIGPLGNAFELPTHKSIALLVGGGVGLPPMFYLAEALAQSGWEAIGFVGAQSHDLLAVTFDDSVPVDPRGRPTLCVSEYARFGYATVITTDDGSKGLAGRITDGLAKHLSNMSRADADRAVVFTCGPEAMMHTAAGLAAEHQIDCQVCLEQAMACGMGTCQSCVVKIEDDAHPHGQTANGRNWRYKLACTDGPVFDAKAVVW